MPFKRRVLESAIIGPGPAVITPCGGCRQKLREFAGEDMKIHLCGPDGLHRSVTLGQGIFFNGRCAATAETVIVLVDEAARKSRPLPESTRQELEKYGRST